MINYYISPFKTSLSNLAPIISKAHVSEAIILAFPNEPKTKGLIPRGSLIAINFSLLTIQNYMHLLYLYKASIIFLRIDFSLLKAIKCKKVSVSDVD